MYRAKHSAGHTRFGTMSLILALAMVLAMFAAGPLAGAGGSADKATGDMTWTRNGTDRGAMFNAHEEKDGRPAKGEMTQWDVTSGSYFVVSVDSVEVHEEDGWACFGGEVVEATGIFSSRLGQQRLSVAIDGGEPGGGVDYFGGNFNRTLTTRDCGIVKSAVVPQNSATSGNVQIHAGK